METVNKILADIKLRRIEKNISGHFMAKELGYKSPATYYKKESGKLPLTLVELDKISVILDSHIFFTNKVS